MLSRLRSPTATPASGKDAVAATLPRAASWAEAYHDNSSPFRPPNILRSPRHALLGRKRSGSRCWICCGFRSPPNMFQKDPGTCNRRPIAFEPAVCWMGGWIRVDAEREHDLQATVEMLAQGGQPLDSDRRAPTP